MPVELTSDQVLVTVGTPCLMSAVGGTETLWSRLLDTPDFIAHAAFDAGLVDLQIADGSVTATWPDGTPAGFDEIEARHGTQLRSQLGIRVVPELVAAGAAVDIAAALPHDLANGGLRRLAGLTYQDIRGSELRSMHGLFNDDPRLGPSLQAQLFAYAGIGALASLPRPLGELVEHPADFRVAAANAFPGVESWGQLRNPAETAGTDELRDELGSRLASALASHGSALVSAMLAPSYPLGKTTKNPELLTSLKSAEGWMRVPQAPLNAVGACASSLIAFADIAPQMLFEYPGTRRPKVALWTAADTGTLPTWQTLDGFGPNALMTTSKLDKLNAAREPDDQRSVAESLAPFDSDANGTVVGDAGSGMIVTTLDFALRNSLDVTSIIVGWGQSGETGGKAHFAGVGFGGENAIIQALEIARQAHGYGVHDFGYLAAHATGTRTNSKTDLTATASARSVAAERAGINTLRPLKVGTPKALGDGHTMGETGLRAVAHALRYVLGEPTVGLPTLREIDPGLGEVVDQFELTRGPIPGDPDGGAIIAAQGFGGYNGAVLLRSATPDALARYTPDEGVLGAYLERWPELRRQREEGERQHRTSRGSTLELTVEHRWTNPDS